MQQAPVRTPKRPMAYVVGATGLMVLALWLAGHAKVGHLVIVQPIGKVPILLGGVALLLVAIGFYTGGRAGTGAIQTAAGFFLIFDLCWGTAALVLGQDGYESVSSFQNYRVLRYEARDPHGTTAWIYRIYEDNGWLSRESPDVVCVRPGEIVDVTLIDGGKLIVDASDGHQYSVTIDLPNMEPDGYLSLCSNGFDRTNYTIE